MDSEPRVALVTGSTSGIGKAIAERLLRTGNKVVLNYSNDSDRAASTLLECQGISPHVRLVRADIGKAAAVRLLIESAVKEFGALDVLINNAARVADNSALEMTEGEWDAVFDVNLKGAFLCSQLAARQMMKQDHGGIILNIGAATGIRARRNGVNTCTSKAALMFMTQCLALELAPRVRVNTIVPGTTVTEETVDRFGLNDPQVRSERIRSIPMGRLGLPEDVADAVMIMLAKESRFITGQRVLVDGGQTMF